MNDDHTFRWMLIAGGVLFGPIAITYRFRSLTAEPLDRWQEGKLILFGLRLSGVPAFVSAIVWMIDPRRMSWSAIALPAWARWGGVVLGCCTGLLVWWTFHNLGRNLTDTVVTRKQHTLVTTGPYRFVRHPFYLAFLIGILSGSLTMANWFILVAGLVPFGFIVARTRIEEAKLVERFGVEYQDYIQRVGRFFPRLRR